MATKRLNERGIGIPGTAHKFKHKTSIGKSVFSRPSNKNKRRSWKKYRGQGA